MAVCGLLSMLCVSPIQPDMDSCPSHSSGATLNNFWQSRAASCLSSTMVDHNDPDDSGSSQPPTPTRTASESRQLVTRDVSLPRHELELSISSLNDAQRSTPQSLRSVKDEFDPTTASTREDTLGGSGSGEEETSLSGPPQKRARMSPIGLRLEENQPGNVREQLRRHPSLSLNTDVSGLHSLMPSRSLPTFRTAEREPSPSPSRGASSPGKPTTSWWLGSGPKSSSMIPTEAQHSFQTVQESARANFAIDARGMIPGTSLQERDFIFKEPSFFPNMLSSMETSEQVRRGEDAPATGEAWTDEQGRPHALSNPREHPFFLRKESSISRVSNISTASEETVPRSGTAIFSKNREATSQEASTVYGQHIQRPFEGPGRRRHPSASESHLSGYEREPPPGGLARQQQAEQRTLLGPPGGNANTTFYARILDAAQQPQVSTPFSQAGFQGSGFNPGGLSFNLAGQSLPRASSQTGAGPIHFGTSGEAANSNLVQQQVNSEVLRTLMATNPSIGSIPPFMSQVQNPDPVRLSFPSLHSLDFLQSLQRQAQAGPPHGTDRYRQPAPGQAGASRPPGQQDFSFLGAPQSSHLSSSAEFHPSLPPRGSQPGNVQTSSGLRDFFSPRGLKGSPSVGLGRGPAPVTHGFSSSALEFPTHLSLQAPAAPAPLTVVMEGRSIGRRISLQDYEGYDDFAAALKTTFDSHVSSQEPRRPHGENCTLTNAIPGYVIAYEDEEGDILLAGDLPWRDFVRAAKQIRIVSSSKISFKPTAGPSRS